MSTDQAREKYQLVGSIGFGGSGADKLTPELRETIRKNACELGGDVVTLGMMSTNQSAVSSGGSSAFWVWATRKDGAAK
jgi:hypothetical protein